MQMFYRCDIGVKRSRICPTVNDREVHKVALEIDEVTSSARATLDQRSGNKTTAQGQQDNSTRTTGQQHQGR